MTERPPESLVQRLQHHGQSHLLRWWDELAPPERESLMRQIEAVDFERIERLLAGRTAGGGVSQTAAEGPGAVPDSPAARARRARTPHDLIRFPRASGEQPAWPEAFWRGRELLAEGKVGVILVAGGQGTRLGFDHPKGMFPIGPLSGSSLFQLLAQQVLARSRQVGVAIPYFIMTSDATHDETAAFFEAHGCFGLSRRDVFFFRQGSMPAVDAATGRLLLAAKGRLSTSPDGHGGVLAALAAAGLFDEMRRRGIEQLYYHQVDNPTAVVCDPTFLGFHAQRGSEMSTKVVAKRSPGEKMGVVVDVDGRTQIIEYSDLPEDVAAQTDESGNLLLWAGSTAMHVFDRAFLERLAAGGAGLPFHLAHKAVPHLDDAGELVAPAAPNAVKFEQFIFDALPLAETALVLEADRAAEFNPVKNREGDDSPATARKALVARWQGWLRAAGANVPDDVPVEISPLFALDAEELRGRIPPGMAVNAPTYLEAP